MIGMWLGGRKRLLSGVSDLPSHSAAGRKLQLCSATEWNREPLLEETHFSVQKFPSFGLYGLPKYVFDWASLFRGTTLSGSMRTII